MRIEIQRPPEEWATRETEVKRGSPAPSFATLDLTRCGFFSPFGLTWCYWALRHLSELPLGVSVVCPQDLDVRQYLARMDFLSALQRIRGCEVKFDPSGVSLGRNHVPGRLVEFRLVELPDDDAVNAAAEALVMAILEADSTLISQSEDLALTISEVLSNTQVHSHTAWASVVAQRFPRQNLLRLAFGDGGRGIPAALEPQFPEFSHAERIHKALERGVTSRLGHGGMGLSEIRELVSERVGAALSLRSRGGSVRCRTSAEHVLPAADFPGTVVEVVLPLS